MVNNWKNIWNKPILAKEKLTVQDLLKLDGFNSSGHDVNEKEFKEFIIQVSKQAGLQANDTVYEIGCGCGAILKILENDLKSKIVGGIDYSEPLCELAKKQFKKAHFECNEAINLDKKNIAEHIFSHSVFQYFRNYDYAKTVLKKMLGATKKNIIVLDIPDSALEKECLEERKKIIEHKKYAKLYHNLHRQFYPKQFFIDFAIENDLIINFIGDNIRKEYMNSKFNFHVIFRLNNTI